jgi:hypothetical protein
MKKINKNFDIFNPIKKEEWYFESFKND